MALSEWLQHNVNETIRLADRLGLTKQIDTMAKQGLTAGEI
jgi:hypothetical protein